MNQSRLTTTAITALRIVLGFLFAAHGWQKFNEWTIAGTQASFAKMGVPAAEIAAPAVAVLEFAGGIALGLDNPFRRSMLMRNEISVTSPIAYEQNFFINNYNRGLKVTFNYAFGKMQQAAPKRKKSIRNDDTKQGDGGSGI